MPCFVLVWHLSNRTLLLSGAMPMQVDTTSLFLDGLFLQVAGDQELLVLR